MNDLSAMYSGISSHYGPHYSSQANLLGGFGAYELEGSMNYGDGTHAHTGIENACVKCHMGFSTANGTGGHNFRIDAPGDLEVSCAPCHNSGASAGDAYEEYYHDVFATVNHDDEPPTLNTTSLYAMLGDKLTELGVYTKVVDSVDGHPDEVHYEINSDLEIDGATLAALFNHRYLYQDHSHGMHNPWYAKVLLTNSYEALEDK
jgi:formate-dependent nitrite reductase cytochrome c552 subunit